MKTANRILVYIVFLWVLTVSSLSHELPMVEPETVGLSTERISRIDKAMETHVAQQKIAGGVTLLARHGKIAHLGVYGMDGCRSRKADDARHYFSHCVDDETGHECRCNDAL